MSNRMLVMSKPINTAFVVSEETAERFLKPRANSQTKLKILKQAEKFNKQVKRSDEK